MQVESTATCRQRYACSCLRLIGTELSKPPILRGPAVLLTRLQRDCVTGRGRSYKQQPHAAAGSSSTLRTLIANAQAEPGPLADVLGGEERLEDPRQDVGRHPAAAVGNRDHDIRASAHIGVSSARLRREVSLSG